MSVDYMLRRPLTLAQICEATGWAPWEGADGRGLTDGTSHVHTFEGPDHKDLIVGFTRYMGHDCRSWC